MKTIISSFIATIASLLLSATTTVAQETKLNFNKNDATIFQTVISDIDSIIFYNPLEPRILSPSNKSSANIGEQMDVSVSGNNIEVKYVGLNGSPDSSNIIESEKGFYTGFMYESGDNKFYFTPNNAIWSNKWVKIIAHDKNNDLWSEPVYIKIQGTMQPTYANTSPVKSGNTGYWLRVKGNINANYNYDKIPTVEYGSSLFWWSKKILLELPVRGIYFSNYSYSKKGNDSVQVSFTAHNRMVSYGKVSVCNANGDEIESRVIQPYSGNITGVWDWCKEGKELAKDFGSLVAGDFIALNAKETEIEVTIPKDGFLTITNDSYIEGLTFVCNLISIVSNAISVGSAYNTDFTELSQSNFNNLKSETFLELFKQESIKNIIFSVKDLNKLTKDDINIILKFVLDFCASDEASNLLDHLLTNESKNVLSRFADASLAKFSMGVSSFVFGVEKAIELGDQINSMVSSWNDGYVKITNFNDDGKVCLELSAVDNSSEACIQLEWQWDSQPQMDKYGYTLYQWNSGLNEWQSTSTNYDKTIQVLNVYPDNAGSNTLKAWMDSLSIGLGKIIVTPVTITNFNSNPDSYLKNASGQYKYDVVMFGSWDYNNKKDLTPIAVTAIRKFLDSGRGVLFGHDTQLTDNPNFASLKDKTNLDIDLNNRRNNLDRGSTNIKVVNDGFLLKYPHLIPYNSTLTIPLAHTAGQAAKGIVWMNFPNAVYPYSAAPQIINGGTNDFYLTTWNNAAMIQTGHSNGASTLDERKVIANTLWYLAQFTSETTTKVCSALDLDAPDTPAASRRTDINNLIDIRSQDNGSLYRFYVKMSNTVDAADYCISNTLEVINKSGLKGFYVLEDDNSTNVPDISNSYTAFIEAVDNKLMTYTLHGRTKYIHVQAVDYAGNTSAVFTLNLPN